MGHFCKDCKHAKRVWFALDYEYARCARTQTVSNLSGKSAMATCWFARNYGTCGKAGSLFEPKRARTGALAATSLALAILAGVLLVPSLAHAAQPVDRPDSTSASIALAVIVAGIIIGLASYAGLRALEVEDRPEDHDNAGRN